MARGAIPRPRARHSHARKTASSSTSAAIALGRPPLSIPLMTQSITASGGFRDTEQVGEIFKEHSDVRHRTLANELLVHVRLPGEALDIRIAAHFDESLSALVVHVPETL